MQKQNTNDRLFLLLSQPISISISVSVSVSVSVFVFVSVSVSVFQELSFKGVLSVGFLGIYFNSSKVLEVFCATKERFSITQLLDLIA